MFAWIAKRTKFHKKCKMSLEASIELLQSKNRSLEKNMDELIERARKGGTFVAEGESSVTLVIDGELSVTVKSRINKDITETLIDNGYITSLQSEDESAINFAFILIANEATEQVIANVNEHEKI